MVSFALALVAIVGAGGGHVLQLVPVETVLILRVEAQCILMLVVGGVIVPQLIHDIEQKLPVSDHRCSRVRRQNLLRGHFADRDVLLVAGVVAAGEACFFKRGIQQRVRAGQQVLTGGINGADEEVDRCGSPLGRQGDVLLNSSGEVILFIAQIPAVEGIAGLGRFSGGLLYEEAPFNKLIARDGLAAVGVKGDFELVDLPLCRQGDVLCDGGIKVIHGGGLLVFAQIPEGKGIALARRVCRFLCIQTVFDHLRVNLAAAVGIEGDFVLVDLPLCRQGDISGNGGIFEVIGFVLVIQIPVREGKALERRVGRRDSLLAALDVLRGRRRTAVSVEGNGIFLRHMHEALRLELPAAPVPDQRDRNDLLIVSDMFQIRELLVELGHIEVGVIADVAKPVVPVLPRLADEVAFIVLAEQIVGVPMLQSIYGALDQNSHFKLFQLVSRRGFGLAGDVDDCADAALVRADRDDLPLVAVTLPCDVGVLIRIQVCMLGVDKRSGVERFDVLVFFKLDLVCPDAVVILPDVFAVLQNFRISGGIRHAEIHTRVILPVLNMYAVGFFALDANRTALIQRGLAGLGGGVAFDFDRCKIAALDLPFGFCSVVFENKLNGVSDFSRRMPGVWIIAVIGIHVGLNIEPNRVFAVYNFFTVVDNCVGFDLVRLFIVSRARGAAYSHAVQLAQIVVLRSSRFDFRLGAVDRNLGILRLIACLSDPPVVSVEFERYGHSFAYARFSLMPGVVSVKGIYIRLNFERHRAFAVLDCADRDKRIVHIAKIRVAMFLGYGAVDVYKHDGLQLIHSRSSRFDFRRGAGGIDRPLRNVRHIHFLICVPFEADQLLCFCRCMLIPLILFQSIIRFDILGSIKGDNNTILFREILHVALNAAGNIVEHVDSVIYSSRRAVYCNLKIRPVDIRAVAVEDGIGDDFRLLQLPDGVEGGIRRDGDQVTLRVSSTRRVWILIPAEEVVAVSGWNCAGDGERCLTIRICIRNRVRNRHVGYRIVRDVIVVGQGVGDLGRRVCDVNNDRRNGLRSILLVASPPITLIVIEPVKCYRCRLPIPKIMCTRPC